MSPFASVCWCSGRRLGLLQLFWGSVLAPYAGSVLPPLIDEQFVGLHAPETEHLQFPDQFEFLLCNLVESCVAGVASGLTLVSGDVGVDEVFPLERF